MNIVHDTLAKCKTHRKVFICDIMGELATGDWTKRLGDWETSDSLARSFREKREIFVIRGEGLTLSPHVPHASPLSSSVFHTALALSAPSGHLPLEGKAAIREYHHLTGRRSRHRNP